MRHKKVELIFRENWTIRPLIAEEDLVELAKIISDIYEKSAYPIGGSWDSKDLKGELLNGKAMGVFYSPFGLVAFVIWQQTPAAYEIRLLGTHPSWEGRGIMSSLMKKVMRKDLKGNEIWLEVHAGNFVARQLYEKLGFFQVGTRPRYYRDGGDAYLYSGSFYSLPQ